MKWLIKKIKLYQNIGLWYLEFGLALFEILSLITHEFLYWMEHESITTNFICLIFN